MKIQNILAAVLVLSGFLGVVGVISAASPDGNGPWADEVVSVSQGLQKDGNAVAPDRSDSSNSLGVAEGGDASGSFYSLGFGGSIVLRFDNPVSNGALIVETTFTDEFFPIETASVDISADGSNWFSAGSVSQDGMVEMPEGLSCGSYVRITDTSDPDQFGNPDADGYDVDGVRAVDGEACESEDNSNPTPTPVPGNQTPNQDNSQSGSSNSKNSAPVCSALTPGPIANVGATRTSGSTVRLDWTPANDASAYIISYGTSAGNYQFGVPNTGDTTSFVIGGLDANSSYFFVVAALNDCAVGATSNEVSVGSGSGSVLGISTDSASDTGGRILGLSTEQLADTGSFSGIARNMMALLVGVVVFGFQIRTKLLKA